MKSVSPPSAVNPEKQLCVLSAHRINLNSDAQTRSWAYTKKNTFLLEGSFKVVTFPCLERAGNSHLIVKHLEPGGQVRWVLGFQENTGVSKRGSASSACFTSSKDESPSVLPQQAPEMNSTQSLKEPQPPDNKHAQPTKKSVLSCLVQLSVVGKLESGDCFSLPDSLRVSGSVCLGSRGKAGGTDGV